MWEGPAARGFYPKTMAILPISGAYDSAREDVEEVVAKVLVKSRRVEKVVPPDQVTDTFQTTKDAFDALVTYFSRMETTGQSDKSSAVKIGQALGADSLLVVKVNAWEYTREEGDNIARVGLSMRLVDAVNGAIVWKARQLYAAGDINYEQFVELVASSAPSPGHCNTMGTASTMNSLAEALGMSLPGCAAPPAPHKERAQLAYETGRRIVDMVWEDLRPSKIMTREAFENVIVVNSAIGGSTNAPIHFNAIAKHIGVELNNDDWEKIGYAIPLLLDMQPAGQYLGEEYHRAGGVPAIVHELMKAKKIHEGALTVNGRTMGENCADRATTDANVIRPYKKPLKDKAGFLNLKGNLFDSAIMKTSVISEEFRQRYLSNPKDLNAFEGRAIVFDGPEDYHKRIDDPALKIDASCILFMRGAGPVGYPGGAEVVNMRPPSYLIKKGISSLACIGDGRQSGTSGSPSILNASPEAATGGGLAILKTGDKVRIDLNKRTADILISKEEYDARRAALQGHGGYEYPKHQTPWQEIQRGLVGELSDGMVLKPAVKYQKIAKTKGIPRDNH